MKKQKPSEVISGFLSFLDQMNVEHMECTKTVETCSQKNIDYLHDMEFAKDKNARNRVATKIHNNQVARREAKDRAMETEHIAKFFTDKNNRAFIGSMKRLLKDQQSREKFLEGERHYERRVGDSDADDTGGQQTAGKEA